MEQQQIFNTTHLRYALFMLLNIENETRWADKLNSSMRKCHMKLSQAPRLTIEQIEMSDLQRILYKIELAIESQHDF